jgi:hypothetical protein
VGEIAINRHRVAGQSHRSLGIWFGVVVGALLLACCAFAGSAFAGGPHPDPPPKPPPPPPPAYHPPPPPPAIAAPPPPLPTNVAPPPAPVVHATVRKHVKRHVAKQEKAVRKPAKPLLAAAGPVAAASTAGILSPALLIVAFGVAVALLAAGVSFMPASAVPFALGLRLERSRQTILLFGLAIGVACSLVGLLTAVVGR